VLKTAPASAWVLVGNTSVIIRFATVNMTSFGMIVSILLGNIIWMVELDLLSAEEGRRSIAGNAHHHQDHSRLIIAISNGGTALNTEVNRTKWSARMR